MRAELTTDGQLTLRGVSSPVTARGAIQEPVTVRHGDGHSSQRLGVDLATTIDRRDFGIDFNREIAEGDLSLGWEVAIEVSMELVGAAGR